MELCKSVVLLVFKTCFVTMCLVQLYTFKATLPPPLTLTFIKSFAIFMVFFHFLISFRMNSKMKFKIYSSCLS